MKTCLNCGKGQLVQIGDVESEDVPELLVPLWECDHCGVQYEERLVWRKKGNTGPRVVSIVSCTGCFYCESVKPEITDKLRFYCTHPNLHLMGKDELVARCSKRLIGSDAFTPNWCPVAPVYWDSERECLIFSPIEHL